MLSVQWNVSIRREMYARGNMSWFTEPNRNANSDNPYRSGKTKCNACGKEFSVRLTSEGLIPQTFYCSKCKRHIL